MKRLFYTLSFCAAAFSWTNKAGAQANTALSNLAATSINSDLLPNTTNARNFGSTAKSWNNIFAQYYYINGGRFIISPGTANTYVGYHSGDLNIGNTGAYNTGTGYYALLSNGTGAYNTAAGAFTLFRNMNGSSNTAIGHTALYNNLSGGGNTGTGQGALYSNTTGGYNTATGLSALTSNTTGTYNTAVGYAALEFGNGGSNSALGVGALAYTSGIYNVGMGNSAGYYNKTGQFNTAIGAYSLWNTTVASFNAAIGYGAGSLRDNGSYNTFLGAYADVYGGPYTNITSVGYNAQCSGNNQVRLGDHNITSIGGFANWSNVSDVRIKKNIKQNVPGLEFINKLQPITYNLDLAAADRITRPIQHKDKDGNIVQSSHEELSARVEKEKVLYTGFAAQDVEKAAKSLNYDFSGVDAAKNEQDLYGLRYSDFVVPLVKAVQELSHQNDSLTERLEKLETMVSSLSGGNGKLLDVLSSASLEQNTPNPFNNGTTINYVLPQQYSSAKITITDNTGKLIKEMNVSGQGRGRLQFDTSTLASGTYQYTLMVNNKLIGSKQMILVR